MPMPPYMPRRGPFYGPTGGGRVGRPAPRRRRAPEYEVSSDESSDEDSRGFQDKSPFKTTYISRDEEKELKTANAALYSQFHLSRQSIFQQFKQKVDGIRHSTMISAEKRKLNVKIAAIDAKVQEKKLFLSYLEMTRPQPTSWIVSSGTPHIMAYGRTEATTATTNTATTTSTTKDGSDASNVVSVGAVDGADSSVQSKVKSMASSRRVKKPKFSDYNVRVLRDWYETHTNNPYPSAAEKHLMCQLTGLTKYQVSRWFCNVRTRKPPPELSDNDEDVATHQDRARKQRTQTIKTDARMFGDYYGRTTAPHLAPYGGHPQHRMVPMGLSPMNFHGMNAMNTMAANPMNFSFQQMMNQKRMNAVHGAATANPNLNAKNAMPLNQNMNQNMAPATEGLMPPISSDVAKPQSAVLLPPPLIEENGNVSKQN